MESICVSRAKFLFLFLCPLFCFGQNKEAGIDCTPVTNISSNSNICLGGMVLLDLTGANTCTWSTLQNTYTIVVTPTVTTTYTVVGLDVNSCPFTMSVTITVKASIHPISSSHSVLCAGQTATLSAGNPGSAFCTWVNYPGNLPYLIINPQVTTSYSLMTADFNGCQGFEVFTQSVTVCNGLNTYSQLFEEIKLFPNYGNGEFTLINSVGEQKMKLILFNSLGQNVFEAGVDDSKINIQTGLAPGIYYYTVYGNDPKTEQGKSGKVIIE